MLCGSLLSRIEYCTCLCRVLCFDIVFLLHVFKISKKVKEVKWWQKQWQWWLRCDDEDWRARFVFLIYPSLGKDTVCLEWLPPTFQNSPPVLYQLIMSARMSSKETSEHQLTVSACYEEQDLRSLLLHRSSAVGKLWRVVAHLRQLRKTVSLHSSIARCWSFLQWYHNCPDQPLLHV